MPTPACTPGDRFGTAWRGSLDLEPGTYRLKVRGDDWARLWVADQLVHDFYISALRGLDALDHDVVLDGGQHTVRAENLHGDREVASAAITWEPADREGRCSAQRLAGSRRQRRVERGGQ